MRAAICLFIAYIELKIAQTVQINQLFKLLMNANEFNTKEKQKLTEIKKLTATYTSSPQWLIPISIEYIKKSSLTTVSL